MTVDEALDRSQLIESGIVSVILAAEVRLLREYLAICQDARAAQNVAFDYVAKKNAKMVDAICSESPIRLSQCGDLVAAADYEKRLADAAGIKA